MNDWVKETSAKMIAWAIKILTKMKAWVTAHWPTFIHFVKGCVLAFWIFTMVILAMAAASGQVSLIINNFFIAPTYPLFKSSFEIEQTPIDYLQTYSYRLTRPNQEYPPLEGVLDALLSNWTERSLVDDTTNPDTSLRWKAQQYNELFRRIEDRLYEIVTNRSISPEAASINQAILSATFKADEEESFDESFDLPGRAVTWVNEERAMRDERSRKVKMIDTFFLLIVLGAFGSLIFLTRDFIAKKDARLTAYIYRPFLGMFLAMAMYLTDLVAHTVITTSDIENVREEPLYLLALAAGLLSETTYELIRTRAQAALDKAKKGRD